MNNVLKLATLARYVVGNRGAARLPKGACSLYGTPLVLFERPPLQQPFKCSSSSSPSLAVRSMQKTEVRHSICLRRLLATMEEGMGGRERERERDRETERQRERQRQRQRQRERQRDRDRQTSDTLHGRKLITGGCYMAAQRVYFVDAVSLLSAVASGRPQRALGGRLRCMEKRPGTPREDGLPDARAKQQGSSRQQRNPSVAGSGSWRRVVRPHVLEPRRPRRANGAEPLELPQHPGGPAGPEAELHVAELRVRPPRIPGERLYRGLPCR